MIGMNHRTPRGVQAAQQCEQFRVDPLRQHDRYARMQPDAFDVRNGVQCVEQVAEAALAEDQRIAAAQDDLLQGVIGSNRRKAGASTPGVALCSA